MKWVAVLDGLMIPESSTSTKTEQGGSALVACGASLKFLGVRSKSENRDIASAEAWLAKRKWRQWE